MKPWLALLLLVAACGPDSVPFSIEMRLERDGPSEMCARNSCDLIDVSCDVQLSLRVVDANNPAIVYVSSCLPVPATMNGNLCSIGELSNLIGDAQIPNTMVQIQLAVWPLTDGHDPTVCPQASFYDTGLPKQESPKPLLGGETYFMVGSSSVAPLTLGCLDLEALTDPRCTLPNGVEVTSNVLLENGLSVTQVVASNLMTVFVGEPHLDTASGRFVLPSSEATQMDLPVLDPAPLWRTIVPAFDKSACIEDDNTTAPTKTLTCALVDPTASAVMIDGTDLSTATYNALRTATGVSLPPGNGLVFGWVIDHTGQRAAGVTVTPSQGTVLYLSDDMTSTNDINGQPLTATTGSGAFVSLDAPYAANNDPVTWTASNGTQTSTGTVIGGRVDGMVTVVQLALGAP